MQIKAEDQEGSKKEIEIELSVEEMEKYQDEAADQLSEEMDIEGFRKGKAPREVVKNSFGEEKFWEAVVQIAVENTYREAIEEKNIFPISQPQVEFLQSAPGNPLIYKASFYVMPDVELPDYKKISSSVVESEEDNDVEVSEKEVEDTIERIRESRASSRAVERGAEEGDRVTVNFSGKIDGEKRIEEEDFEFSLGSGQFSTLEGFEDEVLGMKAGDKKDFTIDIPENSSNDELAGREIDFDLEVKTVMEKELPNLNDEFANSLHENVSDLDELKKKIKEGIRSEKKTKEEESLKMKVVQELIENTELDIPEILVERELKNMKNKLERQIQQNGVTFEDYLNNIDKSEEELLKEWRPRAEDNVAAAIILHKIAEKENIQVEEDEIEDEIEKHFSVSGKSKEEVDEKNIERLKSHIRDMKKNELIFDFLMDK